MKEKNQRIWEIDALRGFLILCVIAAHALFYLSQIRRAFALPPTVAFVIHYGGMLFVVLSGLSACSRYWFTRSAHAVLHISAFPGSLQSVVLSLWHL